jgi:starch phosphorylase
MQIVFAGKAHPKDKPGQDFIKMVFDIAKQEGFKGKVIFIEDYDINVARHLIQGVDVWLNTPRRPLEASGTSGQKGPINGIINFSVLDGWWRESFYADSDSGWSIGSDKDYQNNEAQDTEDAHDIYARLEKEILPLYYDRVEDGIPVNWIKRMKASIITVVPRFSTDRMVKEYTERLYLSAIEQGKSFIKDDFKVGKNVASWKNYIATLWNQVTIEQDSITASNEYQEASLASGYKVSAIVRLGGIHANDVTVEIYYRKIDEKGAVLADHMYDKMEIREELGNGRYRFEGTLKPANGGHYEYTIRVLPFNANLAHRHETGLIKWVD